MEKLYNNIILEDGFREEPSDTQNVPYLINPPEIIDINVGRQLFVDDFLIEETDLVPQYHQAKKFEANPILYPEKEWEREDGPVACPKSGGVWYDEEEKIFKMWYEASWCKNMCYATSKDGIYWERPNLDIEEGTNKILTYEGYEYQKWHDGLSYLRPDSTTVFIDYNCPKEEKYKLFLRNPGGDYHGIAAVSGDGIHFDKFKFTSKVHDRSTIFYNPFRKKWVYSIRTILPLPDNESWRRRRYRECDDYLEGATWTEDDEKLWMSCDKLDLPDPYIRTTPHLYNVDCVGYESIMLGMFQIMYGPENAETTGRGIPKITELIPMYSRDGYHFSRPSREPFIKASRVKGTWDRGYVQCVGGVTIIHGDELWIYYIGFEGDETVTKPPVKTVSGTYYNGATGLAKLRRDGFVSMNGKGTLLTRKLQFNGKHSMFVNAVGTVLAEILDESGEVMGKSSVFCGDSTKAEFIFDNLKIYDLNGKVIRIKFYVDGKLYSFGFADKNGDFGGAHAAGVVE